MPAWIVAAVEWTQSSWPTTTLGRWTLGLSFSVFIGAALIRLFFYILEKLWLGPTPKDRNHIPAWLTGMVERLFFTVLVGGSSDPSNVPVLMFGWIGAKLAANWSNPRFQPYPKARAFTIRALLAGLLSMLFALIGGWMARSPQTFPPF
jgi:hypothetical protein